MGRGGEGKKVSNRGEERRVLGRGRGRVSNRGKERGVIVVRQKIREGETSDWITQSVRGSLIHAVAIIARGYR